MHYEVIRAFLKIKDSVREKVIAKVYSLWRYRKNEKNVMMTHGDIHVSCCFLDFSSVSMIELWVKMILMASMRNITK